MEDATISPRNGITDDELAYIKHWTPIKAPDLWLSRDDTAKALNVGPRTIDRYVRNGRLTVYRGPVDGAAFGVRLLKSEVDNWREVRVKVVTKGE